MAVDYASVSSEEFSAIIRDDSKEFGTPSNRIRFPRRGRSLSTWIDEICQALARKGIAPHDIERCRSVFQDHHLHAEMVS